MKRLFWIIVAACMLHACKPHAGYIISGELADADGLKIVLKKRSADADPVRIDSCIIAKGKFRMKGIVEYPEYCELYVGDNGPLRLFVENSIINIAVDLKNMQNSEVTGSEENDLFVGFNNQMAVFEQNVKQVNDNYMSLKLSDETDVEKEKECIAQMDTIRQQRIDYMKLFANVHPNSIVTALIVYSNLSYYVLPEEMEYYANGFDEINSQSPWVQGIREKANAVGRLAIGQSFVDIQLTSPDGEEIALSDYAGKDKYVLVDFWASWCRPCRIANPKIVKLYNKYKDKGFEIIGVSLDRDKAEWTKAIEDDALTWIHISDLKFWQSKGARLYAINSIPFTVLLDKDGAILAKGLDADELEKKLAELME
jgi:peroxiredoxin